MQALRSVPEQGQLAVVRQRRYVVTDVRQGANGAGLAERPQHLVSLTSIEDDALGEELQVIWEIETRRARLREDGVAGAQRLRPARPSRSVP